MWMQVTPHSASSGPAGVRSSGRPESRNQSALPAVFKLRVSPQLYFAHRASQCITGFPVSAFSGPAGDRSSSCPDSRILQRLQRVSLRFPRCLALPDAPGDTGPGCPSPASSGFAGNGSSSYPESLVLRRIQCLSSRFPSNSALPAAPPDDAMGFPISLILRLGLGFEPTGFPGCSLPRRRLMDPRVTSVLAPSGSAVPASSGCPESCIYGWVDDVSRSSRTLHPRLSPRMNLRIQSRYAHSVTRLWMHSFNLIHAFHLPADRLMNHTTSTASCIVLSRRNYISNSLLAHQLKGSLGLLNLWKQVQKKRNSVDFTSGGAEIENTAIVEQE
jgi:hypothetical protein